MVNLLREFGYLLNQYLAVLFTLKHTYLSMLQCLISYQYPRFLSSPELPDPDMTLHNLQFWNCMDYGVVAVQKQFIGSMHYEVYTRDFGTQTGTYICTLDNYHQDVDAIDYSTSEQPAEHKSHNLIELDNGQFALYPNNRMRIYDNSITPEIPKNP